MWQQTRRAAYLQDVALLYGHVLQLAGLLLQTQCRAADGQVGHHLLGHAQRTLTHLHRLHQLLEALHIRQETLTHTERGPGHMLGTQLVKCND